MLSYSHCNDLFSLTEITRSGSCLLVIASTGYHLSPKAPPEQYTKAIKMENPLFDRFQGFFWILILLYFEIALRYLISANVKFSLVRKNNTIRSSLN